MRCRWLLPGLLVTAAILGPSIAQEVERPPADDPLFRGPTLGWIAAPTRVDDVVAVMNAEVEGQVVALLSARWSEIETVREVYDWSGLEPIVRRLADAGVLVALSLSGGNELYVPDGGPPSPYVAGSVEGWVRFARSAARTFGTAVRVYQIWERPTDSFVPEQYAFVLKSASLGLRAEAEIEGAELWIVQGSVPSDRIDWQQRLWDLDVSPYIDILPIVTGAGAEADEVVAAIDRALLESLRYPPAPAIWTAVPEDAGLDRVVAAMNSSAAVVLVALDDDPARRSLQTRWVAGIEEALGEQFASAPEDDVVVVDDEFRQLPGARLLAQYFSDREFETLLVIDASSVGGLADTVRVVVPTAFVRNARSVDPVTGEVVRTAARAVPGDDRKRELRLPVREYPMLLVYQSALPVPGGVERPAEQVEVQRTRGLTAEEIIARNREVQRVQDDFLDRWAGRGRADFHFKLAQGGATVDFSVESNYFWERGRELEWEQTDFYLNGNIVRWKSIPQLPLFQPEKVVTLPLDLTLDKTYSYKLVGEDRVDDRDAYVLAFEPTEPRTDQTLYRGRVWIDRETFVRLKMAVIQTNLEPPVLSNEERDLYHPVRGPEGREFWLVTVKDGQQVWTAGGRSFVVRVKFRFLSLDINPPKERFDADRDRAYRSKNKMLRDTAQGFRYLDRNEDGTRTLQERVKTSQLFAALGAFKDNAIDGVAPLAGVNYFNYNLFGQQVQTNVLFAGVLLVGTVTYPDLFHRSVDVTLDVVGNALQGDDKVFVAGEEVVEARIRSRRQRAALRFGIPGGAFFKANLIGSIDWLSYDPSSEAEEARDPNLEFVLPPDHTVATGAVELQLNRRGLNLIGFASWSRRSEWSPWGLFDTETGEFINPTFDESQRSFQSWSASVFKEWYLPKLQKLRVEGNYLDGSDFDRFSAYEFNFFGDTRLNGFSGSGVKFEQGAVGRLGYSFNLFEVVRFDAALETASVRDLTPERERLRFTGLGLSGNFVAPWKTIINVDYGIGLQSDIPGLEGRSEFLILLLRLF